MNEDLNKTYPRISIRLSEDERTDIENRADRAGLSMGGYCKSVIFNTPPPRRSRRAPLDKAELARLTGQVSKLGSNVNQIARHLNMTSAYDIVELKEALVDLAEIRAAIMKALGYGEKPSDINAQATRDQFNDH